MLFRWGVTLDTRLCLWIHDTGDGKPPRYRSVGVGSIQLLGKLIKKSPAPAPSPGTENMGMLFDPGEWNAILVGGSWGVWDMICADGPGPRGKGRDHGWLWQ